MSEKQSGKYGQKSIYHAEKNVTDGLRTASKE